MAEALTSPSPDRRSVAVTVAIPVGLTLLVTLPAIARPALYVDEAVSANLATVDWSSFVDAVTSRYDAVHATYDVLLRGSIVLLGDSASALRLPSAIAMAVACVAAVLIGRELGGARLGLYTGLVFAVLPSTSLYASEARSTAFGIAAAAWTTWVFLRLTRSTRTTPASWIAWAGYAVLLAFTGYLELYLALVALAHIATTLLPGARRDLPRLLVAQVATVILLAPLLVLAYRQRGQVSWIVRETAKSMGQIFTEPFAYAGTALIATLTLATLALAGWGSVRGLSAHPRPDRIRFLVLGWTWAVVPGLVLVVASYASPTFQTRYIAGSTAAVALLVAAGLDAIPALVGRIAVAVVCLPLLAAAWLHVTAPSGLNYWLDKKAVVAANGQPGDAVLISPREFDILARLDGLPDGLAELQTLESTPASAALQVDRTTTSSAHPATVWLVPVQCRDVAADTELVESWGYRLLESYPAGDCAVLKFG